MSAPAGPLHKHDFLLRRLHSLSGLLPIGVFLIAHLTTNSTILWGAANLRAGDNSFQRRVATFQEEVSFLNSMPGLLLIEVTLWLSILFHAVLGVYYIRTGRGNAAHYPYRDNWRYSLQRLTGYFSILFIFYHIATLRWGWSFLVPGGAQWSHHYASSTLAQALQGSADGYTAAGLAISIFYFVGVSCVVFHFANGLWTAAITWGLTVSQPAQKRWGYVCTGLGLALMGMAWASVIGFATLDPAAARRVENRLLGETDPEPSDGRAAELDQQAGPPFKEGG